MNGTSKGGERVEIIFRTLFPRGIGGRTKACDQSRGGLRGWECGFWNSSFNRGGEIGGRRREGQKERGIFRVEALTFSEIQLDRWWPKVGAKPWRMNFTLKEQSQEGRLELRSTTKGSPGPGWGKVLACAPPGTGGLRVGYEIQLCCCICHMPKFSRWE